MLDSGSIIAYLGLLNGTIGGTILLLPLMTINAGYVLVPFINILLATISCYTLCLIVSHLGQCKSLKESILEHFNTSHYSLATLNIILSLNLLTTLMVYFRLINEQIYGFISPSPYINFVVFACLSLITVAFKKLKYTEKLLAFGIFTIASYCLFLTWAQITAPQGPKVIKPLGTNGIDFTASLMFAYASHSFAAQLFIKVGNPVKFQKIAIYGYVTAFIIYTYISYGCFAIINRQATVSDPETIAQYFQNSGWEIKFIEAIYLIHLLSVSPELCIIIKEAIFQIFKRPETQDLNCLEIIIIVGIYGLCYLIQITGLQISLIIQIQGSILGFLIVFFMPIFIHIKCVYFSRHDYDGYMLAETKNLDTGEIIEYYGNCACKLNGSSKKRIFQLVIQIIILIIGFIIVVYTLKGLLFEQTAEIEGSQKMHKAQDSDYDISIKLYSNNIGMIYWDRISAQLAVEKCQYDCLNSCEEAIYYLYNSRSDKQNSLLSFCLNQYKQ